MTIDCCSPKFDGTANAPPVNSTLACDMKTTFAVGFCIGLIAGMVLMAIGTVDAVLADDDGLNRVSLLWAWLYLGAPFGAGLGILFGGVTWAVHGFKSAIEEKQRTGLRFRHGWLIGVFLGPWLVVVGTYVLLFRKDPGPFADLTDVTTWIWTAIPMVRDGAVLGLFVGALLGVPLGAVSALVGRLSKTEARGLVDVDV